MDFLESDLARQEEMIRSQEESNQNFLNQMALINNPSTNEPLYREPVAETEKEGGDNMWENSIASTHETLVEQEQSIKNIQTWATQINTILMKEKLSEQGTHTQNIQNQLSHVVEAVS